MSTQKQHSRSAYASFCTSAPLLVTGTAAWGAEDSSAQASLEILSLDLTSSGLELPRVGQQAPLPAPLRSLAWGSLGVATRQSKLGIIAAALDSGDVSLLDPMAMVNSSGSSPVVHSWAPSTGKVNSLTFCPKLPNMLACATSAGEVMLYDITNPRAPRQGFGEEPVATYAARHRGAGASEALAVRFNHVNERILAVGYANGHAHIFDSRKGRAVMEITDESAPRRIAGLAWAPHAQTNLVLASEHDASPTLQFWELRMGKAPKLEYVGHARGVTDVAWCAQEPHVLVSSGKDRRTIVWDAPSGDQLGCLTPSEAGAAIQVAWSPTSPGTFLSCQAGVAVRVASYTGTACGVEAAVDPVTGKDATRAVVISHVSSEPELAVHSARFEEAMGGGLRDYCGAKAEQEDRAEAEYWEFIQVLLDSEGRDKAAMLAKLGFAAELTPPAAPPASAQVEAAASALQDAQLASSSPRGGAGAGGDDEDFFGGVGSSPKGGAIAGDAEADDFFEKLGDTTQLSTLRSNVSAVSDSGALEQADGAGEADVQRYLFVGNHSAAVDACLSHERHADALVIAHMSGSGDLWRETLKQYMRACPHAYLRVVDSQMSDDFDALIKQRPLAKWAETLAILLTYAEGDFPRLACKLAERLHRSSMVHAAALCYICAPSVDSAIALWLQEASDAAMPVPQLQRVLEKSIALGLATRDPAAAHNAALADLVANYALHLVNQGALASAMAYLSFPDGLGGAGAGADGALAVLKDRVFGAAPQHEAPDMPAPHFPFEHIDVPQSAQGYEAQQAIYDAYTQQAAVEQYAQQQQQQAAQYQAAPSQAGYGAPPQLQPQASGYAPQQPTNGYHTAAQQPAAQQYQAQPHAPAQPYQAAAQPTAYQPYATAGYQAPASPAYAPPQTDYERGRYRVDGQYGSAPARSVSQASHGPPTNGTAPPPQTYRAQPSQQPPGASAAGPPPVAPAAPAKPYMGAAHAPPVPVQQPTVTSPAHAHAPPTQQYAPPPPAAPPVRAFQPTHTSAPPPAAVPQQPGPPPQAPPPPASEPPPPAGPPPDCSIYNVDTSGVGGSGAAVVQSLTALFQAVEPLGQQNIARSKEIANSAQRLGLLFWQLAHDQLSPDVLALLSSLAAAVSAGDWAAAQQHHIKLTAQHWNECGQWLSAIKRLIKARQSLG